MKNNSLHRHKSWYELLFSSFPIQLLAGIGLTIILPSLWLWGIDFWSAPSEIQSNTQIITTSAFIVTAITLRRLLRFPGEQVAAYILPTILIIASIAMATVLVLRLPYSNSLLLLTLTLSIIWFTAGHFIVRNLRSIRLALVPFGQATKLTPSKTIKIQRLSSPQLPSGHIDGIVADLHADDITAEWERFLALCTLNHIPVYHIKQIRESLTGRVKVDHLSENEFGTLLPSPFYATLKRITDITAVIILSPAAILLTLTAGFMIRRESDGGMIFTQERIGYRGNHFKLYKLRTMRPDIKGHAVTKGEDDPRITPLGKKLRKYRIDELPQLWNVFKGDMSLIGPRPGPVDLEEWYEQKVPFFSYRHIVRPGISGWAQVMQGYAESADEMREKLEYDFYYIKHFSMWLDMLIVYKTIRTILTGFGSR